MVGWGIDGRGDEDGMHPQQRCGIERDQERSNNNTEKENPPWGRGQATNILRTVETPVSQVLRN